MNSILKGAGIKDGTEHPSANLSAAHESGRRASADGTNRRRKQGSRLATVIMEWIFGNSFFHFYHSVRKKKFENVYLGNQFDF